MINCIGIRKETKDKTQRRAPLSPAHVQHLVRTNKINVIVEPWEQRVFPDSEYRNAGATLSTDLSRSNVIFGVKEIAPRYLYQDHAYCFFSHTAKGQSYNMPMLRAMLKRKDSLFDYELVKDSDGKRLIYFGDYAGYAGMIDSIWALGRRLMWEGISNPFASVKYATKYRTMREAEEEFLSIGEKIWKQGLPAPLVPFVCAFTGYGRVSMAAQRLFDLFPMVEIDPLELHKFFIAGRFSDRVLYKVKFQKPDMFQRKRAGVRFTVDEFQRHPERFTNKFEQYVQYFTLLINGIYWEPRFPRLLTKRFIKVLYNETPHPRLRVIGDITCDIEGSIELTVKAGHSEQPVYVYEPATGKIRDGWEGKGPVVLAVDKLPTELPREASEAFGQGLLPFVPQLAAADFHAPTPALAIPNEFKNALVVHRGHLTPAFAYLKKSIS